MGRCLWHSLCGVCEYIIWETRAWVVRTFGGRCEENDVIELRYIV